MVVAMGNQFLMTEEVVPFLAMITVECSEVAIGTLSKAAMNAGLTTLVYIVYYNFLGTFLLLPTFVFTRRRSDTPPPLTVSILSRFFILGLLGFCLMQIFCFEGIKYSSPTLEGGISNLIPGFTFLLAVIFGIEKLDLRKSSSQAKSLGTIVAIIGASVMTLYKGPTILGSDSPSDAETTDETVEVQQSNWVLGGLLFTGASLMLSGWNVLQTATVKKFPDQITIVFFSTCFGSIQCAVYSLFMERNLEAWILRPGIGMIAVVLSVRNRYSQLFFQLDGKEHVLPFLLCPIYPGFFIRAVFGAVYNRNVMTWCLEKKGPLYVATFKPLFVVIASFTSFLFLGDALHLGSVIGAIIIIAGFYTVIWGKAKEKHMLEVEEIVSEPESSTITSPLLPK